VKRDSRGKFKFPKSLSKQSNFSSWILKDLKDTITFGKNLIQELPSINLLLLQGNLGTGKTSLVKGIAQGIGIQEPITSPTFSLAQHYLNGTPPLVHIDLYRLEDPTIANELFLQEEEEIAKLNGLIIVEWPERLNLDLPDAWLGKLDFINDSERKLQLFSPKSETRKSFTSP